MVDASRGHAKRRKLTKRQKQSAARVARKGGTRKNLLSLAAEKNRVVVK
jgi:hypothetical protein